MAVHVSAAFFTEEDFESYSLQPKFDVNLFKAYNPCIEGCTISPVKKGKPSQTNKDKVAEKEVAELSSLAQLNKNVPSCNSQNVSSCVSQKPQKSLAWNLKSPKPRFPYPRYSCLTHAQQLRYTELWQKHGLRHPNQARYTVSPDDIAEKQQLRKLQTSVHPEQQDFMKYAEHVARSCPKDYEHVPPLALQYAKERWNCQEQRVMKLPQYFSVYQTVGIVPATVFPTDPVLTFSTHLLVLGQPYVVDESTLDNKVNCNVILASKRRSQHEQVAAGRQVGYRDDAVEELSNDENAVRLAMKYQASIVIATSALATLADNHAPGYDKNWQIPVHIKSTKMADTDSVVKTVYISGPLTNPYFPHEASRAFHQVALRNLLTQHPQGQRSLADPNSKVSKAKDFGASMEVNNMYDDSLELDLTNLETFGSSETPCRENLKEYQMVPKSEGRRKSSESDEKQGGRISNRFQMSPEGSSHVELYQHNRGARLTDHQIDSSGSLLASFSNQVTETKSSCVAPAVSEGVDDLAKRELVSSQDVNSSPQLLQCKVSPKEKRLSENLLAKPPEIDTTSGVDPQQVGATIPQLQTIDGFSLQSTSFKNTEVTRSPKLIANSVICAAFIPLQNPTQHILPPNNTERTDKTKLLVDTAQETHSGKLLLIPITDDDLKVVDPEKRLRECNNVTANEQTQLHSSNDQDPEKGVRSHSKTSAQDSQMGMHLSQGSKTNAPRLLSDESDTEGELVIALSSDQDSPQRVSHSQSAFRAGASEVQDVNQCSKDADVHVDKEGPKGDNAKDNNAKDNQQTDLDKTASRTRRRRPSSGRGLEEAASTPRRSKRLLKIQPPVVGGHSPLLHPSERAAEPSLPKIQVPPCVAENLEEEKVSPSVLLSQEDNGAFIPDSPLSPPPYEKGLGVQAYLVSQIAAETSGFSSSLTGKEVESETMFPKTYQTEMPLSESDSPQLKKRKMDSHGISDSSVLEDKQTPPVRYNLRSNSGIIGKFKQSTYLGSEAVGMNADITDRTIAVSSSANCDQSIPIIGKPSSLGDENKVDVTQNLTWGAANQQPQALTVAHREPERHSTNTDRHENRNPKNSLAFSKNTHQVKGKLSLATNKTCVVSTVDSILKLQEQLHSGKMAHQSSSQPPVSTLSGNMHPSTQGDVCIENASDYKLPSEGSVEYSLWRFGRHSVIVKSSLDAVCRNYVDGTNKEQVAAIVPKMEYQPHFGHEQISVSELTKLWMNLLLEPGSKVIQGRVNAMTSDLMMLEHFDMNSALWDQPSFQPSRCMKMMFQILDKLTSLPEGQYLVCHSAGDMHACILQTVIPTGNKRSLFDLHQNYTQVPMMQSCPPPLLPWLPLDTNLMLPGQLAVGRIPATFPPKNTGMNVKGGVAKGTAKKKKKKKKGSKK